MTNPATESIRSAELLQDDSVLTCMLESFLQNLHSKTEGTAELVFKAFKCVSAHFLLRIFDCAAEQEEKSN